MKYILDTNGYQIALSPTRIQQTGESATGIHDRQFYMLRRDLAGWLAGEDRRIPIYLECGESPAYFPCKFYRRSGRLHLGCHHFDAKNSAIIIAWAKRQRASRRG